MEKEWVTGRLGYNTENARYGLLVRDLWAHEGFHCGDGLQVMIDGEWVDTCMEMTWNDGRGTWFLVGTPYAGDDLEYVRARI